MNKYVILTCTCILFFCFSSEIIYSLDVNQSNQLRQKYSKGKFLVLKTDGIPAEQLATRKEGASSALYALLAKKKSYTPTRIYFDGTWKEKKRLGFSDANTILKKGEVLIQADDLTVKNKCIEIKAETTTGHEARGKTTLCGAKFIFDIQDDDTFGTIDKRISEFFEVFNTIEEIGKEPTKELSLGMTIDEAVKILGEPSKKVNLENKTIFKYEDMIITFQNEKIVNIEFK
jgi:hypothetical protein